MCGCVLCVHLCVVVGLSTKCVSVWSMCCVLCVDLYVVVILCVVCMYLCVVNVFGACVSICAWLICALLCVSVWC